MPDKSPYSFHTFIFPFIWEVSDKNKSPIDAFEACLREEWREERGRYGNGGEKNLFARLAENYRFNLSGTDLTREQREALVYNEYKYFHESARKALYDFGPGNKDEILRSYFWPIKVSRNTDTENKPVLGIVKGQDVFRLYVNSIQYLGIA